MHHGDWGNSYDHIQLSICNQYYHPAVIAYTNTILSIHCQVINPMSPYRFYRCNDAIPARTATAMLSFSERSLRSNLSESIVKSSSPSNKVRCFSLCTGDADSSARGRGLNSEISESDDVDSSPVDGSGDTATSSCCVAAGMEGDGDSHWLVGICCGVGGRATDAPVFNCWCKFAACCAATKCCASARWFACACNCCNDVN